MSAKPAYTRKAAARSGYTNYSQAMGADGITWDEQTLDRFIANPAPALAARARSAKSLVN
jgi:cytochrome c2